MPAMQERAYADYPFQKAPTVVLLSDESNAEGTDDAIDITSCREDMWGPWADGAVGEEEEDSV